jgi:outer membrane lipoprotein-sorting protein
MVYKTTTIITLAGRPVTQSQTIEIWQKKPNLMKMITTEAGGKRREVISDGEYMYVKNQATGKWMSLKAGAMPDPFAYVGVDLSQFETSSVDTRGDRKVVVLRGGKKQKSLDRVEATMDADGKRVERIEGYGTDGTRASESAITYKDDGSIATVDTKADSGNGKVESHFEVVTNEIDPAIPSDTFSMDGN